MITGTARLLRWPLAVEACDIAVGGAADCPGSVRDDDPSPPAAVDALEGESFDSAGDIEDRGLIERNEVGIAPHETHPLAVLHNGDGVSGEQRAPLLVTSRPVQHGRAVEMPADPGQVEPWHRFNVIVEQLDPRRRTLDPVLIGSRDQDARVKGVRELDVGGVEMRVR